MHGWILGYPFLLSSSSHHIIHNHSSISPHPVGRGDVCVGNIAVCICRIKYLLKTITLLATNSSSLVLTLTNKVIRICAKVGVFAELCYFILTHAYVHTHLLYTLGNHITTYNTHLYSIHCVRSEMNPFRN